MYFCFVLLYRDMMVLLWPCFWQVLATAGADKKVCVWDVDGGFSTHFFRGHTGVVTTIMFHKDPKHLLVSMVLEINHWSYV